MIPELCASAEDFEAQVVAEMPALRTFALRLCKDADFASDLVQDTLERALANRARFAPGTQLRYWLRTIMRNVCADHWRRANVRAEIPYPPDHDHVAAPAADETETRRWRLIDDDQLESALAKLPEFLRTAFEVHTAEGLTYAALGRRLGISSVTAGTRLLRARRRLRALLLPIVEEKGGGRPSLR